MTRNRALLLSLVVGLLAIPAIALAAPSPPKSGHWKIQGGGGFTVSRNHKTVSGLIVSGTGCELAKKVSVKGKQNLHKGTEGGVTNWLVGSTDPRRTNPNDLHGVVGHRVKIRSGKKTLNGRLDMVFAVGGFARDNSGDLLVAGCDISFSMHR